MAVPGAMFFGLPTRVTASVQIKATKGKIWAIQIEGGTSASSIDIKNAATDTGDILIGATAPFTDTDASSQSSVFLSYVGVGGIDFSTAMYAVLAGTGAIAYVWFT